MRISGIITTILGKTATNTKVAGREIRIHHSKSLPLSLTGERLFFSLRFHLVLFINPLIIQSHTFSIRRWINRFWSKLMDGLPWLPRDLASVSWNIQTTKPKLRIPQHRQAISVKCCINTTKNFPKRALPAWFQSRKDSVISVLELKVCCWITRECS